MKRAFLAVLLMVSQLAYADGSSVVVIAAGHGAQGPAARMKVPADYVAIPMSIHSDAKDPVRRGDEIEKAFRAITEKLAPHPDLKAMPGVISLSPRESKSFVSSESHGGSAQLYVLGSLKQNANVFSVTRRIYQLVAAIPLADGTRVVLGNTALGLDEPERYRSQLLGMIARSVADARKSLGTAGFVEVEGLENPVTVMQLNDREVVLFINYRLRVQARAT